SDTPVVIVSASPPEVSRGIAAAYGIDGYMVKPINTRDFAGQIAAYLIHSSRMDMDVELGEGKTYRILMIEDNANNTRLMRRVLERHNFEVLHAEDGETGIQMAFTEKPDLILLDLGLPDVDGQTVAGMLKQDDALPDVPLIIVTAWPAETAHQMVAAYNCQGYIAKPINTREFGEQIAAFINEQAKS
ncbi:MAG: response regulator, partial [Chloroflexi bacterium]|nr:response regulator [Chloroflexota bacterium]